VTPEQRAVIEAARRFAADRDWMQGDPFPAYLADAVEALERAQSSAVQEIEWWRVAEGDQLKSAKTGVFWEVISVQRMANGTYSIGIQRAGKRAMIARPTEAEPNATVRRGEAGHAVDTFVTVFSSGGPS